MLKIVRILRSSRYHVFQHRLTLSANMKTEWDLVSERVCRQLVNLSRSVEEKCQQIKLNKNSKRRQRSVIRISRAWHLMAFDWFSLHFHFHSRSSSIIFVSHAHTFFKLIICCTEYVQSQLCLDMLLMVRWLDGIRHSYYHTTYELLTCAAIQSFLITPCAVTRSIRLSSSL